jgi:hypothetical protein
LVNKRNVDLAQQLLDRFFRDAEGRTNRQLDVYFTLQDLALPRDKSESALEFLTSRGLINTFGPDIAYLTDKGARAIIDDLDIASLPKEIRDFIQKPIQPPAPVVAEAAPLEPPSRAKRPPRAQLTHIDPDGGEHVLLLGKLCTVGRAPGNDIQVNDQRASKRHAELRWDNGRFMLVDLGSANGTLLNGEYVDQQVLEHEDELVIGRTMLIFQAPEVIPEPIHENTSRIDDAGAPPKPEPEVEPAPAPAPRAERTERPARTRAPEPEPEAEPIKVVKGRPDPVREPPRAPSTLFVEEPPVEARDEPFGGGGEEPADLFGSSEPITTDSAVPQPPASDLFDQGDGELFEEAGHRDADLVAHNRRGAPNDRDLFAGEGSKTADATPDDLFDTPDDEDDDERTIGPGPVPSMSLDHLSTDMAVDMPSEPASFDFPPIEPVDVAIDSPMSPDERTITEPPAPGVISPDYEPAAFETDAWEEETPADAALQGSTVEHIDRIPSLSPSDLEEVEEPDAGGATVAVMRDDLEPSRKSDDLARWGEDRPPAPGSHPEFAVAERNLGESLPVATPSLVNLRVPSKDELIAMADRSRSSFHQTLAALRHHAERADLPDREALLGAIDLLERHAYVRVALQLIERD